MMDNGVPAAISNTAGTYVCNDLMYHLLYQLKHEFPNARGGFIHVPYATIQNHPNMASMTIEEMSKGLALCVEAAIEMNMTSLLQVVLPISNWNVSLILQGHVFS